MRSHRSIRGTIRRTTLAALALVVSASLVPAVASARMGGRGGPDPDRATERLTEHLDLSAEQQEQVRAILEESATERETLREEGRARMDAHREATHARLATVLSAEQVKDLDQLRQERRGRHGADEVGDCGNRRQGRRDCRRDCDGDRGRDGDCARKW